MNSCAGVLLEDGRLVVRLRRFLVVVLISISFMGNASAALLVGVGNEVARFSEQGASLGPSALVPGTTNKIAVDGSGLSYVSDGSQLRRLDSSGVQLDPSSPFVDVLAPISDVDVDASGNIVVATGKSLLRFTASGSSLGVFATAPGNIGGIAIGQSDVHYVVDGSQIRRFTSSGLPLDTLAPFIDVLQAISSIEIGPGNVVYLGVGSQVHRYSSLGSSLSPVSFADVLVPISGLAFGNDGALYVAAGSQVRAFDSSGAPLGPQPTIEVLRQISDIAVSVPSAVHTAGVLLMFALPALLLGRRSAIGRLRMLRQ